MCFSRGKLLFALKNSLVEARVLTWSKTISGNFPARRWIFKIWFLDQLIRAKLVLQNFDRSAFCKTALFVSCHSTLPASYWIVVNLIRLSKSTRFPELHRSDPYRARLKNWYYPSFFWRHHYFSQSFQISPLGEIERGRISVSLLWLILDIMILNKSQNHQKWRKCKTFDLSPNSLDAKWDFHSQKMWSASNLTIFLKALSSSPVQTFQKGNSNCPMYL